MSIYGFIVNGNTEKYDFNALENAPLANGTGRDSLLVVNGTDPNTASGNVSFAAGAGTEASGYVSTAIGALSVASGIGSFAGGRKASSIEYPTTASGEDSFAFGLSAKATGNKSVAFGQATNALANMAFAAGNQTIASGNSSFAMGDQSSASGESAFATGRNAVASGRFAFAGGANSDGSGNSPTASGIANFAYGVGAIASGTGCCVAFGQNTEASGNFSFAAGAETDASGNGSVAFGQYSAAQGTASFAAGNHATAKATGSAAIGQYAIASGRAAMTIGQYNVEDTSEIDTSHGNGARKYLFIIGNGTADNARSNAMTVDWDGNIVAAGKMTVGAQPTGDLDVATKKNVDDSTAIALKAFSTATTDEAQIVSFDADSDVAFDVPVIFKVSYKPYISGSGDPSPTNVRNINGYFTNEICKIYKTSVNIAKTAYESGVWNDSGEKEDNELAVRSTDYIPVARNTTYYIAYNTFEVTKGFTFRKYGRNKDYLGTTLITSSSRTLTTDTNCYFITWNTDPSGDNMIAEYEVIEGEEDNPTFIAYAMTPPSINYPSTDTEWHSHWEEVVEFHMPIGTVYDRYYYGTYNSGTGEITCSNKTITSLSNVGTWTYNSTYSRFELNNSSIKNNIGYEGLGNAALDGLLMSKYKTVAASQVASTDFSVGCSMEKIIYIHDSRYTDVSSFVSSLYNVALIYPSKSPSTSTSDKVSMTINSKATNFFCDCGELSVEYRLKPKESDSEITISVSDNDDVVGEVLGWEDEFGVWHEETNEIIPNTYELIPSKFYHFVPSDSNSSISSLNIVLKPPMIGMAHYHFDFDTGSTAPTVTLPATVNMPSNFYLEANKHYEIDIFNNYGTVVAWTIS